MSLDKVLNNVWEQSRGDQWEEDYGFTMEAAKEAILTDLLEIIGSDEEQPRPNDDESQARFYRVGGKNFVRNELRDKVRKYCE